MADQNLEKYINENPLQQYFLRKFFDSLETLFLSISPNESVLDVGCGEGFTIRRFRAKHQAKYVGIDPDVDALAFARKKDNVSEYLEGSIFSLPFPDDSFDIVLCNEVLEHLQNPEQALKELVRVTKKDVILSVPHEPLFRLSNLLRGRNISRMGNYPFHLQTWTKRSFVSFVAQYLSVQTVRTPFPWTQVHGVKK